MQLIYRSFLLGAVSLSMLAGCDFSSPWGRSSSGQNYGDVSPAAGAPGTGGTTGGGTTTTAPGGVGGESGTTGTDDSVMATPSAASAVVAVGASQTISIPFTSSDGLVITGFGVSGTLGTLPTGWSGPASFTCASVSAGSGCVLNLTYSPTAAANGSLRVNYIYVDNAHLARAPGGSLTIPYQAIADNNVVATATPVGQINAVAGTGNQPVSVNFTTDDGNVATNLTVTSTLNALPAGWISTAASFSCAIVSTGSGCQLPLMYAPTAGARGTLTLTYTYADGLGAARNGAINIPYATSSANTIVASAAPTGQVNAIEKGAGQAVAVTFTTDDGRPATNLVLTSTASALPSGWSGTLSGFACASVSTGNGCQLHLTYAPTGLTAGTLTLTYAYADGAGAAQTGSFNLNYAATTNDNAVATASPSGQINAVVGMGTQAVAVTFTTDDAREATALQLTTNLSSLPAGWSSTSSAFSCAGFSGGNGCQLNLMYAPAAAGTGTLTLNYMYLNNAGESKSGSLNIPYRATTNDNVVGTPSQNPFAVAINTSMPLTITFTTDDGNLASGFAISSGLTSLPAGWSSSSSSLSCASVSVGAGCRLALTYAPTAPASGSLSLGFSYTSNAGILKTGTVTVAYSAT